MAVSLRPGLEAVRHALLDACASVLANMPGARLACVNVVPTSLIAIDENVDAAGDNIHVERLVALRSWAQPLQLPKGKITYHLLESRDVANGVLEFARLNKVEHLILGAHMRGGSSAAKSAPRLPPRRPAPSRRCGLPATLIPRPGSPCGPPYRADQRNQNSSDVDLSRRLLRLLHPDARARDDLRPLLGVGTDERGGFQWTFGMVMPPRSAIRAFIAGSASISLISRLSLSMIAAGVPFGAPTPCHPQAS